MSYSIVLTGMTTRSNNNTEFRTWGKAISDAIANCGIARDADANVGTQINWSTVAAPNTINQSMGYEIYHFTDAMQATTPVYFKIEYGSGPSVTYPALWITVGSGANATGNVTGNTTSRQQIPPASAGTGENIYFSGSNNRFGMMFATLTSGVREMMLMLERTLDSTGAVTSDGLAMAFSYSQSSQGQVLWTPATGNVTPVETSFGILTPAPASQSGEPGGKPGDHLAVYPIMFNKGAKWFPGQTQILCAFNNDILANTTVNVSVYGANTSYMMIGYTAIYAVSPRDSGATGGSCWLLRWS